MPGTNADVLTNPAVSYSGEVDSLLIEKFIGKVHEMYLKGENLQSHFDMQSVKGTNKVSNKYIGETELQVLVPGQEPPATDTKYDKNALVVDTTVIARNTVAQIHDVQNDIDGVKSKLAKNQSKKLKELEDYMIIQQLVYGVCVNNEADRTTARLPGHGFSIELAISDAQAGDPNTLLASIEYCLEKQLEQEVSLDEMVLTLPWASFNVLRDAERLVNKDYESANGTMISGFSLKSYNIPVVPSNRFPKAADGTATAAGTHHKLSNAENGYRYDVDDATYTNAMSDAVAVIFNQEALILGRTIDLQGDIFFDKKTKSFFIDSWFAEGAIPDRWEAASAVFKGGSTNTAMDTRAARKARPTKAIS